MPPAGDSLVHARLILEALRREQVTHVVALPDNASSALLAMLGSEGPRLVGVTREGEAFALASGLWVGGAAPVVLIQNTGLLESGDALRGTAMRMRVPLVCLVTYRGYASLSAFAGAAPAVDGQALSRPDVDSTALLTEPTLTAWGIPYGFLHRDEDVPRIGEAFRQATLLEQPVALLIPGATTA
jgi:thiamine pyrophosphate-dependent acetolactate synthase large subunit-like protein